MVVRVHIQPNPSTSDESSSPSMCESIVVVVHGWMSDFIRLRVSRPPTSESVGRRVHGLQSPRVSESVGPRVHGPHSP